MPRSGKTMVLALLGALTGCAMSGAAAPFREQVRLATWNLEHLAAADGTGCRARTAEDYAALRAHAERLGADVIALQEVENRDAAARVFTPDRWTIVMSDRPETVREGFCRGGSGPVIRRQDVGFAIRKGLEFTRHPDVQELGLGNPDLRWGVDITVRLPRPVRLLAVHLKSGCNAGNDAADRDCPIIFAQAPVLERWIDDRARAGEDFAVLGDWNRRTALPDDAFLEMVSDDDPPAGRIVMADAGRKASCIRRYPDFIDHIALRKKTSGRVIPDSFAEYSYGGSEELYPSDHCPQSLALRAR